MSFNFRQIGTYKRTIRIYKSVLIISVSRTHKTGIISSYVRFFGSKTPSVAHYTQPKILFHFLPSLYLFYIYPSPIYLLILSSLIWHITYLYYPRSLFIKPIYHLPLPYFPLLAPRIFTHQTPIYRSI